MPRRSILTSRQRASLFGLPEDEQSILRYYTLSDDDIRHIQEKRKPQNRIGFALQLCAFRYPGRFLQPREVIPTRMLSFIGAQLGIDEDALAAYGQRQQTKYEHSKQLQAIYGFTPLAGDHEQTLINNYGGTNLVALKAQMEALVTDLWNDGTIKFLAPGNKPIIYGTTAGETLTTNSYGEADFLNTPHIEVSSPRI